LPDHSSLTKIRTRYGLEVFRRFFDAIVRQFQEAGLVWGQELVRPVVIRGIPFTERRGSEQTTSGSWTDLEAKAKGDKSMSQKRETDWRYASRGLARSARYGKAGSAEPESPTVQRPTLRVAYLKRSPGNGPLLQFEGNNALCLE
jgi:hypothetical protein